MGEADEYRPMMPAKRARRLRKWHVEVDAQMREGLPRRVFHLGLELYVPVDVFPPSGSGSFHRLVQAEVRPTDRVLDMGTGSGIDAILAATKSAHAVAADLTPKPAKAAPANAARNGAGDRM